MIWSPSLLPSTADPRNALTLFRVFLPHPPHFCLSQSGFHEAFIDGNRLCIVMEYAPFGDLSRALRKRQAQRKLLPEDLIWSYFIQIARGLQALHAQKILHRDVKTANVLRMSGEVVKLGDLGVAKLMKGAMTNTQIGTPHYMPPEVWRNRPYTYNSDVWALGCVLFEMCTFTVPFEARSMEELRFKVMKGKFPSIPAVYSSDMQKMVKWLLISEPSQRPDINAVLSHPSVERRAHLAPEPETACPQNKGARPSTLETIKVPKNLRMLKKRLPAANYADMVTHSEPAASWPRKADGRLPPISDRTSHSSVSSPGPRRSVPNVSPRSVGDASSNAGSIISAPAGGHGNIREVLSSSVNSAPAGPGRARGPVAMSVDTGISAVSNIENIAPIHGPTPMPGQAGFVQGHRGPGGMRPSEFNRAAAAVPPPVKLPVINSAQPGQRPGLMAQHQGLNHHNQPQYQQGQVLGGYQHQAAGKPSAYGGLNAYGGQAPYAGHMQKGMPLQSVNEEPAAVLARAGLTPAGGAIAGGRRHVRGQQAPSMVGLPGFGHLADRRPEPMARNHYW